MTPAFVLSGATVGLILVLAAGLGLSGRHHRAEKAARPVLRAAAAARAGCGSHGGAQSVLRSAPPTHWELANAVAVPSAPDDVGPARSNEGVRLCFAHSAPGALYAAANVIAMAAAPATRPQAIQQLIAEGPGKAAALQSASGEQEDDSGMQLQIGGFQMRSYTPQTAVIDLALKIASATQASLAHVVLQEQWQQGDWKLVIPADGDAFAGMEPLSGLGGYVAWSGA